MQPPTEQRILVEQVCEDRPYAGRTLFHDHLEVLVVVKRRSLVEEGAQAAYFRAIVAGIELHKQQEKRDAKTKETRQTRTPAVIDWFRSIHSP